MGSGELTELVRRQGERVAELLTLVRDLADRCRRLEKSQAANTQAKPLRISRQAAAKLLEVSPNTISTYVSRGLLLKLPKHAGVGRGATTYFHPDNVAALAQSEDAAREWVAKRKFIPLTKRSR